MRRRAANFPLKLLGWFLVLSLALALAATAADQPAARPQVAKPVQEAQGLIKQKKYADALARLRAADAVPDKTQYEVYVIEETRASATLESGDYGATVKALQAVLATGILPPGEAVKRLSTLVELDYQLKDYAAAVDAAMRYDKAGGAEREPRLLMAQALYLQNDFAAAAAAARDVLRNDERAGLAPDENLLLTLLNSAFKTQDQAGAIDALERLAASHPKPQYWSDLIRAVERAPGFARRLTLDLDRIAVAVGAMSTPAQYVEAAELALEAGFPGDAKAFLDQGRAAGVLGAGPQAERQQRLAGMASAQAKADAKSLPQLGKEADAAADGPAAVKLGEAYASYGNWDEAITALQKGLAKGGLRYPEDAKLHLGIAYLRAGESAKAKELLQGLKGEDGVRELARMWLIEGGLR